MKKQSIRNNTIYQFIYQFIILVIPLVISPYLTRVLGSNGLGEFTYVNSVSYYFVLFANLGIAKHGQRIIASNRDDKEKLRKTFWSLFTLHSMVSLFSLLLYVSFCFLFLNENSFPLYLIHILYVASALFDITWLFYGLENFKSVVIRNAIIKLAECILIFLLVRSRDDLIIYALIMVGSVFLGQFVLLPQAIKEIKPIRIGLKDTLTHIKPLLLLFISVVAASLYTVFDKTLLGLLATKDDVAYYEYANKIINIPKQLIGVIGIVMFPRICKVYSENKVDEQKSYIDFSMLLVCASSLAFVFGIMAIGRKFALLYFGEEFAQSGDAMVFMAPLIYIVMVGDIIRSEYLVPASKDFLYTICISISAVLNIVLSCLLIPHYGFYGAIIGTTVAELFGLVFQIVCINSFYPFTKILKNSIPFAICGAIMFAVVYHLDAIFPNTIGYLLLELAIGVVLYLLLALVAVTIFFKKKFRLLISVIFTKASKKESVE